MPVGFSGETRRAWTCAYTIDCCDKHSNASLCVKDHKREYSIYSKEFANNHLALWSLLKYFLLFNYYEKFSSDFLSA